MIQIFVDFIICEAQYLVTPFNEEFFPLVIIFFLSCMNTSIDLYNKTAGMAVKVDNEWFDDLLAAKMEPAQTVSAQS